MLLTILKKRQRRARLCSRVHHPNVSIMSETLALVSKLKGVQRSARRWTFSIWLVLNLWWGSQVAVAWFPVNTRGSGYSKNVSGWRRVTD